MSGSSLKKFVLTPVVLSATVFAALSLPLAVLGSKPVTIQLQEEPVFQGQLRDVATPYLGFASALSLGAGLASVALTGWRQSTRKSSQVEEKLSDLEQNLKEKEAQLEALKLSESRLEASGLRAFLDEEVPLEQLLKTSAPEQFVQPMIESQVVTTQPVTPHPVAQPQVAVQAAAHQVASAQTYQAYEQASAVAKPSVEAHSPAPLEVEELNNQLQQIMAQMAAVQTALAAAPRSVKSEV
jgi:hypothetical protein